MLPTESRLDLRKVSWLLLAAAGWTLWVWGTRIVNILGEDDHSAGFKLVHSLLALVSVGFGLALGWVGLRLRRHP